MKYKENLTKLYSMSEKFKNFPGKSGNFSAILLSFQRCHTTCGSRHHFRFRLLNILYLVLSNTLVKILFFEQKAIQGLEFIFYNYNKTENAVLTLLPALHIRLNCKFLIYFFKGLNKGCLIFSYKAKRVDTFQSQCSL